MFTASSPIAPPKGDDDRQRERAERIKHRIDRALETFHILPNEALIDIGTVCVLRGRSRASTYRDVADGRLAPPVKVGSSTRWRVGDVRAALTEVRYG